ncbi:MAG: hypothetical protein JKY26_06770 [Pseudomonas sp.]|nr:hypothetical protein [Pseudomonas sp.]
MQPTQLALVIHKGATFRARLRVMQPTPEYRDITAIIAAAPVQLTVDHGLPTDWPIWIERVRQLTALNRAPIQQQPHFARVVDAETLEISTINAAGTNGTGGQIVYYPPLPLTGATAELTLYEKGEAVGTLPVTVDAAGWVDVVLTDEQTEALEWSALEYTLDVQLGSTDVLRVYAGKVTAIAAGTAPATCQGFAVIGADRGPPGPTVSTMVVDDDGYLIITLEDGTVITSPEPLNRPWGTIVGDITTQLDLMGLFGEKASKSAYDQFVIDVTDALAARVLTTDPRLTDSRTPTGGAGGVLKGTYPDPGFAVDMATQQELNEAVALRVAISAIVDDLNSVDTQAPLSANQGRVLKVALDNINTLLTSDNFDLDTFQEIVDFIEVNRETLDSLTTGSIAGLDAALANRYTKAETDLALANKQPLASNLTAFAALTGFADRLPYFTGAGALSLATLTAFGRSLAGSADAAAGRSALELPGLLDAKVSKTGAETIAGVKTFSSPALLPSGSLSAPALAGAGDTNTGLYFPSPGNIGLVTNGVSRLNVTSLGRVGIGTAAPVAPLQVSGAGNLGVFGDSLYNSKWLSFREGTFGADFGFSANENMIGGTTNGGFLLRLGDKKGFAIAQTGDAFDTVTTPHFVVTETGLVGCGTNNPQVRVDVVGQVRASGGFISGSFTLATRPAHAPGLMIHVTDGGAGATFQGSAGGAWVNLG